MTGASEDPGDDAPRPRGRRRLRAVLAADVAEFSRIVSDDETRALGDLGEIRAIARAELAAHEGWLFGMPGDGIFALFESAGDAVDCALRIQSRMRTAPRAGAMRLRIGVHIGEVLFEDGLPFGLTLSIAARLEALAPPGGVLVSAPVRDAVSRRADLIFHSVGAPELKNIPVRIEAFEIAAAPLRRAEPGAAAALDQTMGMPAPLARLFATPAQPPDPNPALAPPPAARSAEEIAALKSLLVRFVGPVANVMVERALASDRPLDGIARDVADSIPDAAERAAFLAEVGALLGGPRGAG